MAFELIPRGFFRFPAFPSFWEEEDLGLATIAPSGLSVYEDDKNVYVEAAVTGVDPKDIEVTFDKGVVEIKGETKEGEKEGKKYYRRFRKSCYHHVLVPVNVDPDQEPEVTCKNGMITVVLAKKKTVLKKIAVKTEK